jgi:AraC-like DNA-binding protein
MAPLLHRCSLAEFAAVVDDSSFAALAQLSVSVGAQYDQRMSMSRRATWESLGKQFLKRLSDLVCAPGVKDPIVTQLASLLLPALANPDQANTQFVDYVTLALCAHLTEVYGAIPNRTVPRRGLTPAQAQRAMDFMAHQSGDEVSLAEVARQFGLSRGYFAESFKLATGCSPHQWLQRHRVERAKSLLAASRSSIAEIASICGFADQSHLSRVFSRLTGDSPAAWRRRAATDQATFETNIIAPSPGGTMKHHSRARP